MDINKRLSDIRNTVGMTTRGFGEKINLTGGAITNMEKGNRNITERTISDICREFQVNKDWFLTGNGEMFIAVLEEDELAGYCGEICAGKDTFIANCLLEYMRLNDNDKKVIQNFIQLLSTNE